MPEDPSEQCGSQIQGEVIIMRKWSRWQDWVVLVAGVYAFLSPIWTPTVEIAGGALVVLGIIAALVALASLYMPDVPALEWTVAVLGALTFISPWVLGFAAITGAAWTAWIVGVVLVAAGLWALPESNRAHQGRLTPQGSH
jgi:SPW repeat